MLWIWAINGDLRREFDFAGVYYDNLSRIEFRSGTVFVTGRI
jgi:hypothetical protein